jgi:uncharacterized protein (TIGR02996 family)
MSQDEPFIEAILAEPDDDGLRLIYADWLEEQGSPHGELIRVQVELARPGVPDRRRLELECRQRAVVEAECKRIGLPKGIKLCRGLAAGDTLALGRAGLDDARAKVLADSFLLAGLASLILAENHIGSEGLAALAGSRYLGTLLSLDLGANHLGNAGAAVLAGSARWPRLERLNLSKNRITDAGVLTLAASPHLSSLATLNLRYNPIGNAGGRALAGSPHLGRLTKLHLRRTGLGKAAKMVLRARFGGGVFFGGRRTRFDENM